MKAVLLALAVLATQQAHALTAGDVADRLARGNQSLGGDKSCSITTSPSGIVNGDVYGDEEHDYGVQISPDSQVAAAWIDRNAGKMHIHMSGRQGSYLDAIVQVDAHGNMSLLTLKTHAKTSVMTISTGSVGQHCDRTVTGGVVDQQTDSSSWSIGFGRARAQ